MEKSKKEKQSGGRTDGEIEAQGEAATAKSQRKTDKRMDGEIEPESETATAKVEEMTKQKEEEERSFFCLEREKVEKWRKKRKKAFEIGKTVFPRFFGFIYVQQFKFLF